MPLPLVRLTSLLLPTCCEAQCNRLLVEWHITHVLDPGTKSCLYVHECHRQERSCITGTTWASTRGDLRASGVDNFPNGGDLSIPSTSVERWLQLQAKGVKQLATSRSQQEVEICTEPHDSHGPEQHAPTPSSAQLGEPLHLKAY